MGPRRRERRYGDAMDWPRICITLLTLAAFGLSSTGLVLIRRDAHRGVARLRREQRLREQYSADLRAVTSRSDVTQDEHDAALGRWRQQHTLAGIRITSWDTAGDEPLAERIILELREGSRLDFWFVGVGLLCGLVASLWSTWLPSA